MPVISVIIRCRDEVESIGRLLDIVAAQELPDDWELETIVVDSGSTDGTLDVIRARDGIDLIEIPGGSFTFGGALNTGSEAARGDLHVALSAHSFPTDDGWLARMIAVFDDPRVCCASGGGVGPSGEPNPGRILQDHAMLEASPWWGYSNGAGGYRAELWRRRPFRPDMPGTEDKEWSWFWLGQGHVAVIDEALMTDHDHGHDPIADTYRRFEREWRGFQGYYEVPRFGAFAALKEWLAGPTERRRFSPRRAAEIAGRWVGTRSRPERLPAPGRHDVIVMCEWFPELSETFIAAEAAALRRAGHDVRVIARERPPRPDDSIAGAIPTTYMFEIGHPARLRALAWLVATRPRACLADLRARRRWRREEEVEPLRVLAPLARELARRPTRTCTPTSPREAALDALRLARLPGVPYSVTAHAYDIYSEPANLPEKLRSAAFATSGCDYTVADLRRIAGPEPARASTRSSWASTPAASKRTTPAARAAGTSSPSAG